MYFVAVLIRFVQILKSTDMELRRHLFHSFTVFFLALASVCVTVQYVHASDGELLLTATQIELGTEYITDSVADLSAGEVLDRDYGIRVRWVGDSLMDITTLGLRCDFTCRDDSLLLTMVETGGDAEVFDRPIVMNASGIFSSEVHPYGGYEGRTVGNLANYVVRSLLVTSEGDTLQTLMNKQVILGTTYSPADNPRLYVISIRELRSYYISDSPWPVAVVVTNTYYDSDYTGIGQKRFALDLIAPSSENRGAHANMYHTTALGKALAGLSPFSQLPYGVLPGNAPSSLSASESGLECEVSCDGGSIRINLLGSTHGDSSDCTVVLSDVRGIVWHAGTFRDGTVIDVSSLPSGEYQITLSDGSAVHTEKLSF